MKTKTLRLPLLFASAGALIWTVSVARAADSTLEVQQDSSTSQKEVINEPSGAERTYSTRIESGPAYESSYRSDEALDPDAEGDRIMHMYQRGRHAAESLDRQIKPNPIVVLPGATTFESYSTSQYPPNHLGELHQQSYSSSFNEPSAAERETTTSTSTTRRYSTTESSTSSIDSTATLSSGTTIKASDLIGMNIKNSQGERIGEVKDAVLDLKTGRVAYTVVSAGGVAGIGDKWLAVPPSLFARTGAEKNLTWDIDKEKLSTAPTIDKHNWNAAYQQDYIGTVYSFYGVESYEANEPAGSQKKSDTQYHHDSEQQDKQDKQDKQDQSRSDASSSSAAATSQAAATETSQQSDLQKSEPEKSASSSADVSKESAGAQPYSKDAQSSSSSSDSKSSTDVNAPAGAQSSSTSSEATKTEPQSGTESITPSATVSESAGAAASGSLPEKAKMALKNDASLAGSAQDVQFEMKEDKLCVKGTVKSEDEKNRILEKVRATAGDTKVDDQLKVSSSSESDDSDNDK